MKAAYFGHCGYVTLVTVPVPGNVCPGAKVIMPLLPFTDIAEIATIVRRTTEKPACDE